MKKKYYAVKVGKQVGIYETWAECEANVKGFSGAIYKGFTSFADAKAFLDDEKQEKMQEQIDGKQECIAYVDGSFDGITNQYSYGMVLFYNKEEIRKNEAFCDENSVFRNVAGEVKGAMAAIDFCIRHNVNTLHLYYDYQGIESWATGAWKTKNSLTKSYKAYIDKHSNITIHFHKVKGHTGNRYNEVADALARAVLNK